MPKYECHLATPNAYNLKWVYSVPCGGNQDAKCFNKSWISCLSLITRMGNESGSMSTWRDAVGGK